MIKTKLKFVSNQLANLIVNGLCLLQQGLETLKYPLLSNDYVVARINKDKSINYLCQSSLIGWSYYSVAKRFKTAELAFDAMSSIETDYPFVVLRSPEYIQDIQHLEKELLTVFKRIN